MVEIRIRQSGGLTGHEPAEVARLDTSDLDEIGASHVISCAQRLKSLSEEVEPTIGADIPRYDIDVRDEEGSWELTVLDDYDPANPLLETLHELLSVAAG